MTLIGSTQHFCLNCWDLIFCWQREIATSQSVSVTGTCGQLSHENTERAQENMALLSTQSSPPHTPHMCTAPCCQCPAPCCMRKNSEGHSNGIVVFEKPPVIEDATLSMIRNAATSVQTNSGKIVSAYIF